MKKLTVGILVFMSLSGCERVQNPLVGNWSYTLFGTVTYNFNADKSCSVTAPDLSNGGTKTLYGRYTFTQPDSNVPPQLEIIWQSSTAASADSLALITPITWNPMTRGLSVNLNKQ